MNKKGAKEKPHIGRLISIGDILMIVIISVVFAVLACLMSYRSAETSLSEAMDSAALAASAAVENKIAQYTTYAQGVASTKRIYGSDTTAEEKTALLAEKVKADGVNAIIYCTPDGKDIASGKDYASEPFFQSAVSGNTYISSPYADANGDMAINVAVPAWQDGTKGSAVVGTVMVTLPQKWLNDLVESVKVGTSGRTFIINNQGDMIASPVMDDVKNKTNFINEAKANAGFQSLANIMTQAISGKTGFTTYTYGGVKKFVATDSISGSDGWVVCLSAPVSDFTQAVTQTIYVSVGLVILFLIIGISIMRKMIRSLEVPITQIVDRLAQFAAGDVVSPMPEIDAGTLELSSLVNSTKFTVENTGAIIKDIDYLLTEMSNGNFDIQTEDSNMYIGDYENILTAFKRLKEGLTDSFRNIIAVSDQVSAGASQVSSGAQSLAQGSTEQASSIQELSASISEISQRVKENASNAEKARGLTEEAGQIMETSNADMDLARQAMDEISATSKDIGKVIKAIDDIAFQTNILALNAAVEAARAGSAGKGFAVVADEVRNLSQKSAEAAKNTTGLIESAISAVGKGTDVVNRTSAGFNDVAMKASQIQEIVENIATQTQNEAASIEQISIGIDQVSSVVQMNSATSEESAAASEELSSQAVSLNNLIEKFQLPPIE